MTQGDIYGYTFKAPDKRRPVLILTRNSAISFLTALTVAPITTTIRGIPTEVVLTPDDGVRTTCAVNLDNIQTVPKTNLRGFITHLSVERMREVRAAIAFALGFDALVPDFETSQ
ncbi:MAG TPA: type II toxin-antitoxin system PemK/MazF family toxin [Desulfobacterales bacterium]|nr:type II toxin-antitoxin system PemK/MazF family toxin [Desulfobacterales bacterium]